MATFSITTYLWCTLGIVISVLLPIVWEAVRRYFPKPVVMGQMEARYEAAVLAIAFWRIVAPYLILGIASLVTALLIVALGGETLRDYRAALLAGYAWDSTLQKFRR